ncbi:hypothetical protein [Haloarchaeobius sp. DFWS5]|uniref:hypothetical protein n=1 Tax=Haloarchaeobius sp. DFWS5 TaxID=3446114 RepID=UPI003EB91B99
MVTPTVVTITILVGELASNIAMAAIPGPVLINVGPASVTALGTTSELGAVIFLATGRASLLVLFL